MREYDPEREPILLEVASIASVHGSFDNPGGWSIVWRCGGLWTLVQPLHDHVVVQRHVHQVAPSDREVFVSGFGLRLQHAFTGGIGLTLVPMAIAFNLLNSANAPQNDIRALLANARKIAHDGLL